MRANMETQGVRRPGANGPTKWLPQGSRLWTARFVAGAASLSVLVSGIGLSPATAGTSPVDPCLAPSGPEFIPDLNGAGTSGSPYEIATASDLVALARTWNSAYLSAHYLQTADIDLSACANFPGIGKIGEDDRPFTGVYDGGNFEIANLTIDRSGQPAEEPWGVFRITKGATIRNLDLIDVDVSVPGDNVGALAGRVKNTTINNVTSVDGTVTGSQNVGGLIGDAHATSGGVAGESNVNNVDALIGASSDSTISNTSVIGGTVTGFSYVGGLIGYALAERRASSIEVGPSLAVERSRASAEVRHGNYAGGGLIGFAEAEEGTRITVTESYATGSVDGGNTSGGLIGGLYADGGLIGIERSFATGNITAPSGYAGGLVAEVYPNSDDGKVEIVDTYATGAVTGSNNVGGLISFNIARGTQFLIESSYAVGAVEANPISAGSVQTAAGTRSGGIIGMLNAPTAPSQVVFKKLRWDTSSTGETKFSDIADAEVDGVTITDVAGGDTTYMQTLATFVDAGWSIAEWNTSGFGIASDEVWVICEGQYPIHTWYASADICGTGEPPLEVAPESPYDFDSFSLPVHTSLPDTGRDSKGPLAIALCLLGLGVISLTASRSRRRSRTSHCELR